jgi:hypothetical protein
MIDAGLDRDSMAGKKRELRGTTGKAFERRQPVGDRELSDRVHLCIKLEWGDARARVTDFGNAKTNLRPHVRQRIACHFLPPVERSLSHFG